MTPKPSNHLIESILKKSCQRVVIVVQLLSHVQDSL